MLSVSGSMVTSATYRLVLAYDGAAFWGFARQPDRTTVEGALRAALGTLPCEVRALAVAGRTDRGVSADGQVVSFRLRPPQPEADVAAAVDAAAPEALQILSTDRVPRAFHAAFGATRRRYAYLWPDDGTLPAATLDQLVGALVGRRDFTAYARDTPAGQSTVRRLEHASVRPGHHGARPVLVFRFVADAFLRRQVRVMVATAVREARRGAPADALVRLAETRDRTATAPAADPIPLRLVGVDYGGATAAG